MPTLVTWMNNERVGEHKVATSITSNVLFLVQMR